MRSKCLSAADQFLQKAIPLAEQTPPKLQEFLTSLFRVFGAYDSSYTGKCARNL